MSGPALEVVALQPRGHALRLGKLTLATYAKGTRARRQAERLPRLHVGLLGLARSVEARLAAPAMLRALPSGSEVDRLRKMLAGDG